MRRQNPAFVVHEGHFSPFDLALTEAAAKLAHGFHDAEEAAGGTGMGMREHSAMGIDGELAADAGVPLREECAAFAELAEPELLELDDGHDREAVVESGELGGRRDKPFVPVNCGVRRRKR